MGITKGQKHKKKRKVMTDDEREHAVAMYRTGAYSIREIARKFDVSPPVIMNLVQGITQDYAEIINRRLDIEKEIANKGFRAAQAINDVIEERLKNTRVINDLTLRNMKALAAKLTKEISIYEHKLAQEAIDKAAITLRVADRHAPKGGCPKEKEEDDRGIDTVGFDFIEVEPVDEK